MRRPLRRVPSRLLHLATRAGKKLIEVVFGSDSKLWSLYLASVVAIGYMVGQSGELLAMVVCAFKILASVPLVLVPLAVTILVFKIGIGDESSICSWGFSIVQMCLFILWFQVLYGIQYGFGSLWIIRGGFYLAILPTVLLWLAKICSWVICAKIPNISIKHYLVLAFSLSICIVLSWLTITRTLPALIAIAGFAALLDMMKPGETTFVESLSRALRVMGVVLFILNWFLLFAILHPVVF